MYASEYLTYGIGREPALAMDYDGGIKYYICDHLGSVRTIFDEDGNVLSDHEFEPFGNEFFDTKEDNRLSWIGKERDKESLLGDFGARKYDFLSGRFTSIDPLWEEYYEWTPYQYGGNNPVLLIDENGMNWFAAQGSGVTVYSAGSGGGVSGRSPAEQQMVEQDYFYFNWIVNASQSTASVESSYTFWNYLYFGQYYVPIWCDCRRASDAFLRGDYAEAAVHFAMGLTVAYGISKSLLQNFGYLFFGSASSSIAYIPRSSLTPTHFITKSKKAMTRFVERIKAEGIEESIKYVEYKGSKYIVDGHHRYFAAQKLGIQYIPVQQVQLPYGGYHSIKDLFYNVGKQPGWWKYYQP